MYCSDCGKEIDDGQSVSFCPNCGNAIDQQEASSAESNTPTNPTARESEPSETTTGQKRSQTLSDRIVALGITRIITFAGGGLVLVSAFLPWVTAITGGQFSANATETRFGTIILIAGVAILGLSAVRWGRGIGWITMLLAGIAGAGVAYIGLAAQVSLSATRTIGTVSVRGEEVPLAAVDPGVGVTVAVVAGGLVVVGSLFGIIGSFTGTSR